MDDRLIDDLNRACRCISIDPEELARQFVRAGTAAGLDQEELRAHPQLFAQVPVFVGRAHVERMQAVVAAVEAVVALPGWRDLALRDAPAIARQPEPTRGVFFGYDFHIGAEGPQLIEINTNAGGALLNTLLAQAQRACCEDVAPLRRGPHEPGSLEDVFLAMFAEEWRLARGGRPLRRIAIVDDAPEAQFLYLEFLLFQALFERAGIEAVITAPEALSFKGGALRHAGRPVDLVYNRLTDFYLEAPAHAALRDAYESDAVVVTPHPAAHALYAHKLGLVRLSDPALLRSIGADEATVATLEAGVPRTLRVDPADAEALWRDRKRYFFKPVSGYGSKAAYRGDKLTRGTFAEILQRPYVAQRLVPPSERDVEVDAAVVPLKLDLRAYTYAGRLQLLAARLYHGQTTNFRTAGGGFAPVYTDAFTAAATPPAPAAG